MRKSAVKIKSTTTREIAIAVLAGAALLAFILWGIVRMGDGLGGHSLLAGTIVAKHFQPRPEEQLTIGKGGLDQQNIDGVYTMDVHTADGRTFTVFVDKKTYDSHQPGDTLTFRPPPAHP